jgi:hypothetical protein
MSQICQSCHAQVDPDLDLPACPACGGKVISSSSPNLDGVSAPQATFDHRGILLPARHAVGGVITPR